MFVDVFVFVSSYGYILDLNFFFYWYGDHRVLHSVDRRQRQMCIRDSFTSSTRQTPKIAELGEAGEEFEAELELKLLADVGLVGFPNAGKSTFLSVVSNARPEIANYEFTTLTPNLGVADVDDGSILIADIPGLIEGASEGKGLGDQFLRHVEPTRPY